LFWEGQIGLESPKTTKRDAEGVEGERSGEVIYPIPSRLGVWRSVVSSPGEVWAEHQLLIIFGHQICSFVRFHTCFSAFLNLTGKTNKTDPIQPLLPAIGLEGARVPCTQRLDPPVL